MLLWLSQCNWTLPCLTLNYIANPVMHKASLETSYANMYSASDIDIAIMDWSDDFNK